jgi:hypothetical protein
MVSPSQSLRPCLPPALNLRVVFPKWPSWATTVRLRSTTHAYLETDVPPSQPLICQQSPNSHNMPQMLRPPPCLTTLFQQLQPPAPSPTITQKSSIRIQSPAYLSPVNRFSSTARAGRRMRRGMLCSSDPASWTRIHGRD